MKGGRRVHPGWGDGRGIQLLEGTLNTRVD